MIPDLTVPPLALALEDASSFAPRENALFYTLVIASCLVVAGLAVANGIFLVRYRRGSRADRTPSGIPTWKVETAWITATTVIFLGFFFWGARLYLDMERAPADATEVHVIARQWMWDTRYPNGKREFNALHVEVGQAVRVVLSSEDVIHSFFVPAFRVKQDVVPGKLVSTWFTPTKTGEYPLYCTQYCGSAHSRNDRTHHRPGPRGLPGVAGQQAIDRRPSDRGREALHPARLQPLPRSGIDGCRPSLAGLYGQVVRLADGTFVRADETYLHDAILTPGAHPVAGYPSVMPSFAAALREPEVMALIAYLRTLAPPAPNPGSPSVP